MALNLALCPLTRGAILNLGCVLMHRPWFHEMGRAPCQHPHELDQYSFTFMLLIWNGDWG